MTQLNLSITKTPSRRAIIEKLIETLHTKQLQTQQTSKKDTTDIRPARLVCNPNLVRSARLRPASRVYSKWHFVFLLFTPAADVPRYKVQDAWENFVGVFLPLKTLPTSHARAGEEFNTLAFASQLGEKT